MTTCPTCGQLTDNNHVDGYTLVSMKGKRQRIVDRIILAPIGRVHVEGHTLHLRSVPIVCVVDREADNDSIAEDHRLDRVVYSGIDRRVEVVR